MASGPMLGRVVRWTVGGIILGAIVGAAAFAALREYAPRYTAEVLYEVLPPPSMQTTSASLGPGGREEIERFIETQASVIESDRILRRAAESSQVAATTWAGQSTIDGKYVPAAALRRLREIVGTSIDPGTNLIRLTVATREPADAATLATAIDETFRRDHLVTTRDAQRLVEDLERKVRERRQDVAAIDIRIQNITNEQGLTVLAIDQTAPYLERNLVLSRLVEARSELAALPPTPEGQTPSEQRQALERIASHLSDRLRALNEAMTETTQSLVDVKNLQTDRAQKMDQIRRFEDVIADLGLKIEQGSRIRVLSPAAIPDERSSPVLWVLLAWGAAVCGAAGLVLGLTLRS